MNETLLQKLQRANPNFSAEHLKRFELWDKNFELLDSMLLDLYVYSKQDEENNTQALKRLGKIDQLLSIKEGVLKIRDIMKQQEGQNV